MNNNKVLIVEDEAIIALEIEDRLINLGFEVCAVASSAESAIQLTEKNNPALILMDIKLRGKMSGIEAAKIINEKFETPIIYITAFMDAHTIEEEEGAVKHPHLIKPIQEDDLKATIEKVLKINLPV